MLRELHISNLAVIADARIELNAGLNCFTGATGAGKSLVIGAIEILLGLRSPAEMLRPGVDEGRVSGVFDVRDKQTLRRVSAAADMDLAADAGELLLTRRLYASGRTSVSINGNPITLAMLKLVAEHLVDVHGQHDHQFLLKPANQLEVLDQFAGAEALRGDYGELWTRFQDARRRIDELSANRTLRQQQLELYRFQAQEIDTVELKPGEYEELTARESVLRNIEKLKKDANSVHSALYEADGSVLERLRMMVGVISELAGLDPSLANVLKGFKDATIGLEETAFDLNRYLDHLDLDPAELAEVQDRLNALNRILHKYGGNASDTLAYREEVARKIDGLEKQTDDLSSLQKEIEPLEKKLRQVGEKLSATRQSAAKKLSPLIVKSLAELGMEKATFSVVFAPPSGPGDADDASIANRKSQIANLLPSGLDQIEFTAQTNPGQLAQPLRKIASGGELSRIMLALKGILARTDRVSVLVFDEIDANVGGRLGSIIGSKLRELSRHHQVLCITHLPQIASYADRHLTVRKAVKDKQTQTTVRVMDGDERIEELAEMIGGQRITDTTRAQARELLDSATSVEGPSPGPKPRRPARQP
ncbi:MAG: DNA repair protein RecN [Tepidisphaerales bacterium]